MNRRSAIFALAVAALTLSPMAAVPPDHAGPRVGRAEIESVIGSASYSVDGQSFEPLKEGLVLKPGATIRTGADSTVEIFLGINGPSLRVFPNTTVGLDALSYTGSGSDAVIETDLNLIDGRIIGDVKKLSAGSRYEIKTPNGVAGVRGSIFDIATRKNRGLVETVYSSIEGIIVVADTGGTQNVQDAIVRAGETFIPGRGVVKTPAGLLAEQRNIASLMGGRRRVRANVNATTLPAAAEAEIRISPRIGF